MTVLVIRKRGRQPGSKSQKTLLKAQADYAFGLLAKITEDETADPMLRINAAAALIEAINHRGNTPAKQ